MGYIGKLAEKNEAQNLRKQGYSYGEIQKNVKVSKDTLSRWCKDIELTLEQKERLIKTKSLGQKKGSLVAAGNKKNMKIQLVNKAQAEGIKDVGTLAVRDAFIAGLALYVAEGTKRDGHIAFSNSDPRLIKFMAKWFRNYLHCDEDKMRARIWIHETLSVDRALQFWSTVSNIPKSQFIKTYIVKNKTDSKKVRKNIHEYGVCTIYFSNSQKHRQLTGWIYALFSDKITPVIDP